MLVFILKKAYYTNGFVFYINEWEIEALDGRVIQCFCALIEKSSLYNKCCVCVDIPISGIIKFDATTSRMVMLSAFSWSRKATEREKKKKKNLELPSIRLDAQLCSLNGCGKGGSGGLLPILAVGHHIARSKQKTITLCNQNKTYWSSSLSVVRDLAAEHVDCDSGRRRRRSSPPPNEILLLDQCQTGFWKKGKTEPLLSFIDFL